MYLPYVKSELRNRSQRTAVNVIGIAIGIGLYVAINAIAAAYQKAVMQPFAELGADLVIQRPESGAAAGEPPKVMRGIRLPFSNQPVAAAELSALQSLDNVAGVSGSLLLWDFVPKGFRSISGVDLARTEQDAELGSVRVNEWISQGERLRNPGDALVEKHFAKFHNIKVGDAITLGEGQFTVSGLLEIKEGAQIAAANYYISLADAQALLPELAGVVNVAYVRLDDPAMLDSVRRAIVSAMPDLSVGSSDSFVEMMGGISLVSGWFSRIVSGIALAGAALLVLKSMSASLVERLREIGVLKALGWTKRNIQEQLLGEAVAQCVLGGLLGIALGYLGAYMVGAFSIPLASSWELNPLPAGAKMETAAAQAMIRLPVAFSWELLGVSLLFSVLIGCIAAYVLGRTTTKMKP
ncbi:MAG: ABC transporter permease, partial [Planctomycetota bacterium]|nr:ABC transporter permease [Planctomycetota bacterium]